MEHSPYTALAEIYDTVMAHVDYDGWAHYAADLIRQYGPSRSAILELGCGTGNLTIRLAATRNARYLATDASPAMLSVARQKLHPESNVELQTVDFTQIELEERFGIVILAYDGINYITSLADLTKTLEEVHGVMEPGGVFLFDQSTPTNSINNLSYFDDEFVGDDYSYARKSTFNEVDRIHVTRFVIQKGDSLMTERHEQRAFTRMEMSEAVLASGFTVEACLAAFEFEPAGDDTERIQWVLRKPGSDDNKGEA